MSEISDYLLKFKIFSFSLCLITVYATFFVDYPGSWNRFVQNVVMGTGLWDLLFDCHCNSETWKSISEAGFKTVSYERFYASSKKTLGFHPLKFLSPHVMGYAET